MQSSSWPPSLRYAPPARVATVERRLLTPPCSRRLVEESGKKCTPSNQLAVQYELQGLVKDAMERRTVLTTDWDKVKLESCVLSGLI